MWLRYAFNAHFSQLKKLALFEEGTVEHSKNVKNIFVYKALRDAIASNIKRTPKNIKLFAGKTLRFYDK